MNTTVLRAVFSSLLLLVVTAMIKPDIQAAELAPHLHKTTLDNGLNVIVRETPGSKVATVQIWVKAGSVFEDENEGGITHLIEHMIFKGTPSRGPGRVAGEIEEAGGRINAYTSYENTVYHATLSARHWDKALEVLTDAVRHSIFDPEELAREQKVVLEEIGMRRDRPSTRLFQELMETAYTVHPYRLPIIGTEESVSGFTRDDILAYMEKHYHPKNFTVVVVGDVRVTPVLNKVAALLGDLSPSPFVQASLPQEPVQEEPRFFSLEEDINQTNMALALPTSRFDNPDTPVLDVISSLLGHGETSRLYHVLRNKKRLVYKIDASSFTPKDPGLLEVTAILEAENALPALEAALEEIFKLKFVMVSEEELEKVKRNLESDFVFNMERVEGLARVLGSFDFLTGDPRENDYLDQIRAVTRENVLKVASIYFTPKAVTAGFLAPVGSNIALDDDGLAALIARAEEAARQGIPPSLVGNAYLTDLHRFTLDNGIKLLVREDHEIPTVGIQVVFPGGLRSESLATNGAFAFISQLLPTGTVSMDARQLSLQVANMAGNISGFNGKNTFGLRADFLARFAEEGLALVRDVIRTPAFDPEEAEKIRPELLAQLMQQEDSLPSLAFREFNRILFNGHPYALNTAGSETALKGFTPDQLREIYERHAEPRQMVLAVSGDVKADRIREVVEQLFGDWQNAETATAGLEESILPPDPPLGPQFFNIDRDKEQIHILIGFLGTSLHNEDRYALEVLDTVLSGQSGRLFSELRDRQSLAYSLSSFSLLGLDTGSFGIYIGTSPDKKEAAIRGVWQELARIQEELISEEELQKAKNILVSNFELGLQTHSAQALDMALSETYELGQDFGNRFIHHIEQVDAKTVRETARKYIQAKNYVMITVGAASTGE